MCIQEIAMDSQYSEIIFPIANKKENSRGRSTFLEQNAFDRAQLLTHDFMFLNLGSRIKSLAEEHFKVQIHDTSEFLS